jgi:hypothetical protein
VKKSGGKPAAAGHEGLLLLTFQYNSFSRPVIVRLSEGERKEKEMYLKVGLSQQRLPHLLLLLIIIIIRFSSLSRTIFLLLPSLH